ncbi:hypothetical protein [Paludibaculum fermentans]|uniref:hypothetical protein n=1 Tax=Paludibaculum fermentans TaxID=1473598 RepID=UPI003EBFD483
MIRPKNQDPANNEKNTAPDDHEVVAALDRVTGSEAFSGAARQIRFLRFVVKETLAGRADGVKESVIAVSVFGRDSQFDPRSDSSVRVEARNIRVRLNEYYMTAGRGDPVVIELPKGGYVPRFRTAGPRVGRVDHPMFRRAAVSAAVLLLAGAVGAWIVVRQKPAPASIAVLPFAALTDDTSDYVTDSFVEDLISELARIPELRVAARTSSFRFRAPGTDPKSIGRQLDVGAILRGTVGMESGHLKVNVELLNARTGTRLWNGQFEKASSETQQLERELCQAIATQLGLGRAHFRPQVHQPPEAARIAYWQGRYALSRRQARADATRFFERAVEADPAYADAWAALAITRSLMAFHWEGEVNQLAGQGREAAGLALKLDESAQEAHYALAILAYSYDHDWAASERHFQRVFEINPNWAYAHRGYALALASHSAFDQAFLALDRAQRLDPLSVLSTSENAAVLLCARRFDEAMSVARKHLALDPNAVYAQFAIGVALSAQGHCSEAVTQFNGIARKYGRSSDVLGRLGYALACSGRAAEAREIVREIARMELPPHAADVHLAMVYTGLGEGGRAIEILDGAVNAHVIDTVFLAVEPAFVALKHESGYASLCGRLGLPR